MCKIKIYNEKYNEERDKRHTEKNILRGKEYK